jgi:hypothetical protein
MGAPILAPAAVLVLWSMIMLLWVVATRFPAFAKAGVTPATAKPGSRYQDVEPILPERVNWKSHNFTHLMEQPTIFYAVVVILALSGAGTGVNVILAWAYVGLRVLHSLWQSLVNTLPIRIALFAISSTCLLALAVNAVRATLR